MRRLKERPIYSLLVFINMILDTLNLLAAAESIFGGGTVRPPFDAAESVADGALDAPPKRLKKFIPNPFFGARYPLVSSNSGNCR